MIHLRADRIEATGLAGEHLVLCSEICRSEYEERFGLSERGEWRSPAAATTLRQ
jgi:hypothetical protein